MWTLIEAFQNRIISSKLKIVLNAYWIKCKMNCFHEWQKSKKIEAKKNDWCCMMSGLFSLVPFLNPMQLSTSLSFVAFYFFLFIFYSFYFKYSFKVISSYLKATTLQILVKLLKLWLKAFCLVNSLILILLICCHSKRYNCSYNSK